MDNNNIVFSSDSTVDSLFMDIDFYEVHEEEYIGSKEYIGSEENIDNGVQNDK